MSLVLTSGPAVEPISLAEAKAHLRVDHSVEDLLIQSLIITSRLHIEAALGLALITQGWQHFIDKWPKGHRVPLPIRPVQTIGHVKLWGTDDSSTLVAPSSYFLDGHGLPARLVWQSGSPPAEPARPGNGIEIALTAGFGAAPADVPAPIRHALLLLVAHWYEHRDPAEIGSAAAAIPAAVSELLAPYRRRRV